MLTADDVLAGYDLSGKRFLVTGTSSGIGRETARALTTHGATVVGTPGLDLASLRSIRDFADKVLADRQRFDVVIANAGVMATPFSRTVDGFERQLGINHIGHFVLLNRVESLIADHGRVIVLSSQAHRFADIDLDDLNFDEQPYDPWLAYGRSKTANALFAVEFDRRHRGRGIRAASVMPGNSLTGLTRHVAEADLQALFANVASERAKAGLPPPVLKDIPQAAATSVWAALVASADDIGGRYLEDCAVAPVDDTPNPFADGVKSYALDGARAAALWAKSEELVRAAER